MTDYPNPAGGLPPYEQYGGAPAGGYQVPPYGPEQVADPLISPNYNGWWNRGVSIAKRGWRPLAALQAVGVVLALLVQAPAAVYLALVSEDLNRAIANPDPDQPVDFAPLFGVLGLTVAVQAQGGCPRRR